MKSSPSIWHHIVSVKWTVNISSIFVAFLENMNINNQNQHPKPKLDLSLKCTYEK